MKYCFLFLFFSFLPTSFFIHPSVSFLPPIISIIFKHLKPPPPSPRTYTCHILTLLLIFPFSLVPPFNPLTLCIIFIDYFLMTKNFDALIFCLCSCYRPTIGTEHKPEYCNESWPFSESVIQVTYHFYLIIRN